MYLTLLHPEPDNSFLILGADASRWLASNQVRSDIFAAGKAAGG
jgi:hypothetical protein